MGGAAALPHRGRGAARRVRSPRGAEALIAEGGLWSERHDAMTQAAARTVLFLCTGNYYRSRFAEVVFNAVAARLGLGWRAASRGLALERGVNNVGPMAAEAVELLETMGLHGEECRRLPAPATEADLAGAA